MFHVCYDGKSPLVFRYHLDNVSLGLENLNDLPNHIKTLVQMTQIEYSDVIRQRHYMKQFEAPKVPKAPHPGIAEARRQAAIYHNHGQDVQEGSSKDWDVGVPRWGQATDTSSWTSYTSGGERRQEARARQYVPKVDPEDQLPSENWRAYFRRRMERNTAKEKTESPKAKQSRLSKLVNAKCLQLAKKSDVFYWRKTEDGSRRREKM